MRDIASILVKALAAAVIGGDYRQAPEDKALAADKRQLISRAWREEGPEVGRQCGC